MLTLSLNALITNTCKAAASDIVGLCRAKTCSRRFLTPLPAGNLGHVVTISADVLLVVDELVADGLLRVCRACAELGHAIDHVADQMEPIQFVEHAHIEWRRGGALLPVAVHVDVIVPRSPIGEAVNEPRITMEGKDDWLGCGEQGVEILIRKAMRMLTWRLQLHQVHHVDDADLQVRRVLSQEIDSRKGLERRHVAAACHHDIGLTAPVIAGPLPVPPSASAGLAAPLMVRPRGPGWFPAHDGVT